MIMDMNELRQAQQIDEMKRNLLAKAVTKDGL